MHDASSLSTAELSHFEPRELKERPYGIGSPSDSVGQLAILAYVRVSLHTTVQALYPYSGLLCSASSFLAILRPH